MADIDIADPVDGITVTESVSRLYEMLFASIYDASSIAESLTNMMDFNPVIVDTVTGTDVVSSAPSMAMKLYRGINSISVTLITIDWNLVDTFRQAKNHGVPLKGIILIPGSGGPDTFSIKDGSDSGSYLFKGAVSTTQVVIYPGSYCKPYIDYSECTLTTGHTVTFVW